MSKYLGQHFLKNKNKIKKIVDSLELKKGELIIEIGPGHGELTKNLKSQTYLPDGQVSNLKILAIEKDHRFVLELREKFAFDKNIEIIEGDALKTLKSHVLHLKSYKIVGNIPFYITGHLLRILGELKNKPSLVVLTIQKEVAERIMAGSRKMNLLAASVRFWAEPKIIGYISKKDFQPAPEVDSAIIRLETRDKQQGARNVEGYYKFIKVLFKQPRKTILNNLASGVEYQESGIKKQEIIEKLRKIGVIPNDRPQDLSVEQILKLSSEFK